MLHNHQEMSSADLHKRVDECLEMVGHSCCPEKDYPHQFSGGMKAESGNCHCALL